MPVTFNVPHEESSIDTLRQPLDAAVRAVRAGDVVLLPTDTTYALAADATNRKAIERIYDLKKRPPLKPMHVIVSDLAMASDFVHVTQEAQALAAAFLPGPLTLVLQHKNTVPHILVAGLGTLGIRIPRNSLALSVARMAQTPITATSANRSGQPDVYDVPSFVDQFVSLGTLPVVGVILDQGNLPHVQPSTIVDLSGSVPTLLRAGPISMREIEKCLETSG